MEKLAGVNLFLTNVGVVNHLPVLFRDGNIAERHPVNPLDIVGAEQVHRFLVARQLESNVGNHDPQRQGLDANLLVRVLTLGVQERHDVRVERADVDRSRALASSQLVCVRK